MRALRVPRTFQHIRTLPQYRSHWHPFYRWKNKLLKIPQLQCGKAGFELRLAHVPLYTTPSFSSSHLLGSNPPPTSRLHQAPVPLDASTRPPGLVLGQLLGPDGCSARSTTSSMPTEENLLCAQGLVLQGGGGGWRRALGQRLPTQNHCSRLALSSSSEMESLPRSNAAPVSKPSTNAHQHRGLELPRAVKPPKKGRASDSSYGLPAHSQPEGGGACAFSRHINSDLICRLAFQSGGTLTRTVTLCSGEPPAHRAGSFLPALLPFPFAGQTCTLFKRAVSVSGALFRSC